VRKSTRPPALIPSSKSLKDSWTSAPLQSLHTPTMSSLSSFSYAQDPKGFCPSSFSYRWRNMDSLLANLCLKQPLAECLWVFSNPTKIPQWILLQITKLKEFSSSCACLHTNSNAHLAEYPLRTSSSYISFFCAPMHPLNAHLAELSESLVILFLP
jgi:hypothetical protein